MGTRQEERDRLHRLQRGRHPRQVSDELKQNNIGRRKNSCLRNDRRHHKFLRTCRLLAHKGLHQESIASKYHTCARRFSTNEKAQNQTQSRIQREIADPDAKELPAGKAEIGVEKERQDIRTVGKRSLA